jgi:hypothetical protein
MTRTKLITFNNGSRALLDAAKTLLASIIRIVRVIPEKITAFSTEAG